MTEGTKDGLPRTACLVMVRDQARMLARFLAHHAHVFDHLYLLDHRSARDLRGLASAVVTPVRVNAGPYLQLAYPNLLVRTLGLPHDYDWLFLLDVDEFVPLRRDDLRRVLRGHRRASSIKSYWRNGYERLGPAGEPEADLFFRRPSSTKKQAVNTARIRRFNFTPGAHHVKYHGLDRLRRLALRRQVPAGFPLLHLPLGASREFAAKLRRDGYPSGVFADKIRRNASPDVLASIEAALGGGVLTEDALRLLSATYRTDGAVDGTAIGPDDFEAVALFDDAADRARYADAIARCDPVATSPDLTDGERAFRALGVACDTHYTRRLHRAMHLDRDAMEITLAA